MYFLQQMSDLQAPQHKLNTMKRNDTHKLFKLFIVHFVPELFLCCCRGFPESEFPNLSSSCPGLSASCLFTFYVSLLAYQVAGVRCVIVKKNNFEDNDE